MDEHLRWQRRQLITNTAASLEKHGFRTACFETSAEARTFLLQQGDAARTIGFGGSMSLAELGLVEAFAAQGKTTLVHGRPGLSPEERRAIMQQQLGCDLFLSGTNAVSQDGALVNIDATGNRVCSMAFGPQQVWVVAGANKIVMDIAGALRRVREVASPPNARRLGYKTPCAVTGVCSDCDAPDRICRITTIIERCPRATNIGVCLVNENLGY